MIDIQILTLFDFANISKKQTGIEQMRQNQLNNTKIKEKST